MFACYVLDPAANMSSPLSSHFSSPHSEECADRLPHVFLLFLHPLPRILSPSCYVFCVPGYGQEGRREAGLAGLGDCGSGR